MKIAYVRWIDSALQRAQISRDELCSLEVIETVGVLVREGKDAVVIARDAMHEGDIRDVVHIPWINVYEYRVGRAKALGRRRIPRAKL